MPRIVKNPQGEVADADRIEAEFSGHNQRDDRRPGSG
jgi:hypothetical protein